MNIDDNSPENVFDGWDNDQPADEIIQQLNDSQDEQDVDESDVDESDVEEPSEEKEDDKADDKEDDAIFDFGDEEKDEEEQEEKETEKEEESESPSSIEVAKVLAAKGFIPDTLSDELTEEQAEDIIEESYNESMEEKLDQLFESYPPLLKNINKYFIDGGDPQKFLTEIVSQSTSKINDDLDISQESAQELVVTESHIKKGYDKEEAETYVEFLKNSGKLKTLAEKEYAKFIQDRKESQQRLVQDQEQARKQEKQSMRDNKNKISTFINENEEIQKVTFSRLDKRELPTYMTDKSITLHNGTKITQMHNDLADVLKDEKKSILLATLLRDNFDLTKMQNKMKSELSKTMKNKLRRTGPSKPNSTDGRRRQTNDKTLADYFL